MNIIVLTHLRMFGEGLAAVLQRRPNFQVEIVNDLPKLRDVLGRGEVEAVLIDVALAGGLFDVREVAIEWPEVPLIAVGLNERRQDVVACGRAGYSGYVAQEASVESLCNKLEEIVSGRLTCSPEISSGLLKALFYSDPQHQDSASDPQLTRRESEVLQLLGRGFSNKEIAQELCLSVATVKHHVHHVLEKMQVERRAQAMRRVRDERWLARMSSQMGRK